MDSAASEKNSVKEVDHSLAEEFYKSFTESLVSPAKSVVQIYDHHMGTRYDLGLRHKPEAPPPAWTGRWLAQESGSVAGSLPWLFVAHKMAGAATRVSIESGFLPRFAFATAERTVVTRSAFTGLAMGSLFNPSHTSAGLDGFWKERLSTGLATSMEFSALTGFSIKASSCLKPGLTHLSWSLPEGSHLSRIAGNERTLHALSAAISGIPAGALGAEARALLTSGRLASADEVSRSMASLSLTGTVMGSCQALKPMTVPENFVKRRAVVEHFDGSTTTIKAPRYLLQPGDSLIKASPYLKVGAFEFYRPHDLKMLEQRAETLSTLALQDSLTDLPNNRAGELNLAREFARAQRTGNKLSLVFFDLDGFKAVNDLIGHGAGDHVLKTTSKMLRDRLRQADTLYRKGGDEFVAILPDTDEAGARHLTNNIQENTRLSVQNDAGTIRREVSVSAGAVTFDPASNCQFKTATDLLKHADSLMYENKAARKKSAREALNQGIAPGETQPPASILPPASSSPTLEWPAHVELPTLNPKRLKAAK